MAELVRLKARQILQLVLVPDQERACIMEQIYLSNNKDFVTKLYSCCHNSQLINRRPKGHNSTKWKSHSIFTLATLLMRIPQKVVSHLLAFVSILLNTKIHVKNDKVIWLWYVDHGHNMILQCKSPCKAGRLSVCQVLRL